MYKVFLVEDEIVVRNGIKRCINWEDTMFEFCGEASDGEMAISAIRQKRPDIVITDIRMPFLDGLQLSEMIKKDMPETKIIILSGYDDFTYAKTAIQVGVSDYLLKPIDSQGLLGALNKIAKVIEKEKSQKRAMDDIHSRLQNSSKAVQDTFLNELVTGIIPIEKAFQTIQEMELDILAGCYCIIVINMISGSSAHRQNMKLTQRVLFERMGKAKDRLLFNRTPESLMMLVKGNNAQDIQKRLPEIVLEIEEILSEQDIKYVVGVGKCVNRLNELEASYRGANEASEYHFFFGHNRVVFEEEIAPLKEMKYDYDELSQVRQEKIYNFLQFGEIEELDKFLRDYLTGVGVESLKSVLRRYYVFMNLVDSCMNYAKDMGLDTAQFSQQMKDMVTVLNSNNSVEELLIRTRGIMENIIGVRDHSILNKYSEMLNSAIKYINLHYGDGQLSLNRVAAYVNMSSSHFSTVFRQETGQTFRDYLAGVRMSKACELLKTTGLQTSEITFQVGYNDPHYFSVAFKKVVGMSPKEYRSKGMLRKQGE